MHRRSYKYRKRKARRRQKTLIQALSGSGLDYAGDTLAGVYRRYGETDQMFRGRILHAMLVQETLASL